MKIALPVSPEGSKDTPNVYTINIAYVRYVQNAGYVPILVTPENSVASAASECDGLILPGGKDLDSMHYGLDNESSYNVDPVKDAFERALLYAFLDAGKPVFGICRGFQLIFLEYCAEFPKITNAKFLYAQHLGNHNQVSSNLAGRTTPTHFVSHISYLLYNNRTLVAREGVELAVNSMHHQAALVKISTEKTVEITKHFTLLAWSTRGAEQYKNHAVVEAFSLKEWRPGRVLAVQWHPEELNDVPLLKGFFGTTQKDEVIHVAKPV